MRILILDWLLSVGNAVVFTASLLTAVATYPDRVPTLNAFVMALNFAMAILCALIFVWGVLTISPAKGSVR